MAIHYFLGCLIGFSIMGIGTYVFPHNISGVNQQLVKEGLAHYDDSGMPIWVKIEEYDKGKECKKAE